MSKKSNLINNFLIIHIMIFVISIKSISASTDTTTTSCEPSKNANGVLLQDQFDSAKEAALWDTYNSWTWKDVYCTSQKQGERYSALVNKFPNDIYISINAANIWSLEHLHNVLKNALKLPKYYGNNFDALYDLLTDVKTYHYKKTKSEVESRSPFSPVFKKGDLHAKKIHLHFSGVGIWEEQIGKENVAALLKTLIDVTDFNNNSSPDKIDVDPEIRKLCPKEKNNYDPNSLCDLRHKFEFSWFQ